MENTRIFCENLGPNDSKQLLDSLEELLESEYFDSCKNAFENEHISIILSRINAIIGKGASKSPNSTAADTPSAQDSSSRKQPDDSTCKFITEFLEQQIIQSNCFRDLKNAKSKIEGCDVEASKKIEKFLTQIDIEVYKNNELTKSHVLKSSKMAENDRVNFKKQYLKKISESIVNGARCLALYGRLHECGVFGVLRNLEMAVYCYENAAILKNPFATYRMGMCHEFGIWVYPDPKVACCYYRLGYKLGYGRAMYRYARMLLRGNQHVEQDIKLGHDVLKMTVKQGSEPPGKAYYDLGMLYKTGNRYLPQDERYAFDVFMKGAATGCAQCQFVVGEELETGENVPVNTLEAAGWFKKAANNGQPNAQYKMVCILIQNVQNINDEFQTNKNRKRNNQSDAESSMQITMLKMPDKIKNKDMKIINLSKLYGENIEICKEAFKLASSAAETGDLDSIVYLGIVYETGVGTEKDLLSSLWFNKIGYSLGAVFLEKKIIEQKKKIDRISKYKYTRKDDDYDDEGIVSKIMRYFY
ncbi:uncharacterized protein ENBRE01_3168 [Enteropsectra breve]|nr:uncharacterized protein ENBRE01_3168 [Enteropsectra breve]